MAAKVLIIEGPYAHVVRDFIKSCIDEEDYFEYKAFSEIVKDAVENTSGDVVVRTTSFEGTRFVAKCGIENGLEVVTCYAQGWQL